MGLPFQAVGVAVGLSEGVMVLDTVGVPVGVMVRDGLGVKVLVWVGVMASAGRARARQPAARMPLYIDEENALKSASMSSLPKISDRQHPCGCALTV